MKVKSIILSTLLINSTGVASAVTHRENRVYFRKIEADGSYSTVLVKYPKLTVKGTKKQIDTNIECKDNDHSIKQDFLCIRAGRHKTEDMYDDFAKDVFAKTLPVFHYYTKKHKETMHDLNFYTLKFNLSLYPKNDNSYYICPDVALTQTSSGSDGYSNRKNIWGFYSTHPVDSKIGNHSEGNKSAFICEKHDIFSNKYLGHEKIEMTKTHEGNEKFALKFLESYFSFN